VPAKEEILQIVETLPETMSFDEIMKTLSLRQSDEHAMDDIRQGRVYTPEQLLRDLLLPE
jgi:hypothetical protein